MRRCIEAEWLPSGFAGALVHPIDHAILRQRTLSESLPKRLQCEPSRIVQNTKAMALPETVALPSNIPFVLH